MVLEARVQRAQAAQGHEAVERRAGEAEAVGPPDELLVERRVSRYHRPADHVAVAVQVLRRRVHDQVRPERERLLPGRRQEGVVDHGQRTAARAERGERVDVGDAQQRVARASRSTAAPRACDSAARTAASSPKSTNSTCALAARRQASNRR